MTLSEKASYLKGLADGVNYDKTTPEGKILAALIDLTGEMAAKLGEIDAAYINDYIDELDHDLGAVEQYLVDTTDYEIGMYDDEDDDDDDDDEEFDGDCKNCDEDCEYAGDDDDDDGDFEYYEVVCPSCGETICVDSELATENIVCPACGEKFECIVSEDDLKTIGGDNDSAEDKPEDK